MQIALINPRVINSTIVKVKLYTPEIITITGGGALPNCLGDVSMSNYSTV